MNQFDTKMTALADAIKAKNANAAAKLSIDGMIAAVNEIEQGGSGNADIQFGYINADGQFQSLDLSGDTPVDSGDPVTVDAVSFNTGKESPEYGGNSIQLYRCVSTQPDSPLPAYQNAKLTGNVQPSAILGDYANEDPVNKGTNRIFSNADYRIGYDKTNAAWCISPKSDAPFNYVNSVFYASCAGISTQDGTSKNPIWWDSEGVAGADRLTTGDYNTSEASYDSDMMYEGWNFYVNLKGGVEYTIGIVCPTGEDIYAEPNIRLYDASGKSVAYSYSVQSTPVQIGSASVNVYMKYTPASDGLYQINMGDEYNSIVTPVACSPAPETSVMPSDDLFEQTQWNIGGGSTPGVRIVSAGLTDVVQDFALTKGDGTSADSYWVSADEKFCIESQSDASWIMRPLVSGYNSYIYATDSPGTDDNGNYLRKHPGTMQWTKRYTSSYGNFPVCIIRPIDGVSGNPIVEAVAVESSDAKGYSVWQGVLVEKAESGVWVDTSETAELKSANKIPVPGNIYSADGDIEVYSLYRNIKNSVYTFGASSSSCGYSESPVPQKTAITTTYIRNYSNSTEYMIDADGYLFGRGGNSYGQLGNGNTTNQSKFIQIGTQKFKMVSAGEAFMLAIDEDGYLWGCGYNNYGQLGTGNTSSVNKLTKIGEKTWKYVHCAYQHSVLIDTDDLMWVVGNSNNGQLGLGTTNSVNTLTQVGTQHWTSVYGSESSTFAIDTDGFAWACGSNNYGQLGVGSGAGSYVRTFTKLATTEKFKKIASGNSSHTLFISDENYMFGCGYNNVGQLGNGKNGSTGSSPIRISDKKWRDISCYMYSSFGVDEYGILYRTGESTTGVVPYRMYSWEKVPIPGVCTSVSSTSKIAGRVYVIVNE